MHVTVPSPPPHSIPPPRCNYGSCGPVLSSQGSSYKDFFPAISQNSHTLHHSLPSRRVISLFSFLFRKILPVFGSNLLSSACRLPCPPRLECGLSSTEFFYVLFLIFTPVEESHPFFSSSSRPARTIPFLLDSLQISPRNMTIYPHFFPFLRNCLSTRSAIRPFAIGYASAPLTNLFLSVLPQDPHLLCPNQCSPAQLGPVSISYSPPWFVESFFGPFRPSFLLECFFDLRSRCWFY